MSDQKDRQEPLGECNKARCRACHYGHHNECEDDRCACRYPFACDESDRLEPLPDCSKSQSKLSTVPVTLRVANAFVDAEHRHHTTTTGHKSSVGVTDEGGELRGVAIMEYPKARRIDRDQVCEVTRVATDGCANACSALYGAMCRLQKAHGFKLAITYTLLTEPGTSLFAAGWRPVSVTNGGTWSRTTRKRLDKHPLGQKIRWECRCSTAPAINLDASICATCGEGMVLCPWGGFDCPACDVGHHDGPDYELPFSQAASL